MEIRGFSRLSGSSAAFNAFFFILHLFQVISSDAPAATAAFAFQDHSF